VRLHRALAEAGIQIALPRREVVLRAESVTAGGARERKEGDT
jgi:hypothetical protein